MTIADLYKRKADLFYQAEQMKIKAQDENRQLDGEELTNFQRYLDDMDAVDKQIEQETRFATMQAKLGETITDSRGVKLGEAGELEKDWNKAFSKYMRMGARSLTPDERDTLNITETETGIGVPINPTETRWDHLRTEKRATNSVITNPTYLNPVTMADEFGLTLKAIGPWMDAVSTLNTPTGGDYVLPYYNDGGNDGALEAAGTDAVASSTDLDTAKTTLTNYWISSTGLIVNWATLRDADYPVNEFIVKPMMNRLARAISTYATTGTGSSQPKGIAICAVTGELAAKATAPTQTDLNNLLRLVDYSYHVGPKSGWMFHSDTMFRMAAAVKSTTYNQDPLWQPSFAAGIPATLLGYKYWINNSMNTITTAPGNSVLFGDFSQFVIRYVGPLIVTRLEERYAEKGQVAFLLSQFMDSNIKIVGTTYAPIKKIKNIMT